MQPTLAILLAAATAATAAAQSHVVVPAAYTGTDALSYEWLAGATRLHRQQTLVGASHLTALVGRTITAIELRRTTVAEGYNAGAMDWNVTLSTSPNQPVECSNLFAANVGQDAVNVFQGSVALPASPPTTGPGSTIAWSASNTLRVALATPFVYQGGTLCVDVTGTPIAGQEAWWMADAAEEVVAGSQAVDVGAGCGIYGGPTHRWSQVHVRSLVPGGRGVFRATGTPNAPTLAMFGAAMPNALPLSLLGITTPNCFCHLDPLSIAAMVPALFEPESHPLAFPTATAQVLVTIPASPAVFGFQMTTQWFDLAQLATSNAVTWTIANAIPSLDMALVEGHPLGATGTVTNYLAHVLRFEYQ
jgi:hypothetical protein